ncbi:MAG: respiratory nitrate reductase subunit gamma [Burkholderiaceae bacterium]|nr:respiratory nitrate reductase subunit gamma [Burkholderiaceae bacterium]
MSSLHTFLFGVYPYLCLAVFLIGSLIRFDREPYTWKADSSQLLRRGQLRLGSNLFHVGILGIFVGHLFGLLLPAPFFYALGIDARTKQMMAIVLGGFFGLLMLAGLALLMHRRFAEPRVRATTTTMDWVVLWLLLAQLLLGLFSIAVSWQHRDGGEMIKLMTWAQHIVTFRSDAAAYVADVAPIFKLHLVLGLTIFLVFPFSRLVHVWSGFAALAYLVRPYQLVRARR